MLRLSAWLAAAIAVPLSVAQLYRNWGNWTLWWTWGLDELVAALLLAAGVIVLRGGSGRYLAPAWAFSAATYLNAALVHRYTIDRVEEPLRTEEQQLMLIVAGLTIVSIAGIVTSLYEPRKA